MGYIVLAAWLVQACVGLSLLVSWARHARGRDAGLVLTHVTAMIAFAVPWTAFIVTGTTIWAWTGFAVLLLFIGFGDAAMVRRARARSCQWRPPQGDYGTAIRVAHTERLGKRTRVQNLV
jgi:hypothetical protein